MADIHPNLGDTMSRVQLNWKNYTYLMQYDWEERKAEERNNLQSGAHTVQFVTVIIPMW